MRPATAPSALRYGLPGTTQIPSNRSSAASAASSDGIQYGSSTSPSRAASASIRPGMRVWARTAGERSPTSARVAIGMDGIFDRAVVHVQRSFAV